MPPLTGCAERHGALCMKLQKVGLHAPDARSAGSAVALEANAQEVFIPRNVRLVSTDRLGANRSRDAHRDGERSLLASFVDQTDRKRLAQRGIEAWREARVPRGDFRRLVWCRPNEAQHRPWVAAQTFEERC